MASKATITKIVNAAAEAGITAARQFGDPAQKKQDSCLSGKVRNNVLREALSVLTDSQKANLLALEAEDKHKIIASLLHLGGCMLCDVSEHMEVLGVLCKESNASFEDVKVPSWPSLDSFDKLLGKEAPAPAKKAPAKSKAVTTKKAPAKAAPKRKVPKRKTTKA